MHLVECILDTFEPDALGHELLQRQSALAIEVDQGGEVALRKTVAVPGRLQRSPAGEEVHQRHLQAHIGCRNTHQDNGSGEIAGIESLLPGFRSANGVDHDIGAEAVGQFLDLLDDVVFAGVDGVGGAELPGPLEFGVVGVDGDDRACSDQFCTRDGGVSHSAAADHGDGIVATDSTGIDRRTDTGHHPAAQ